MGLKEGAIATYDRSAASHQVYAEIKGVWASDLSRADGRYFILGTEGSEFIVTNGKGIYKTGQQLLPEHLSTAVGLAATTQTVSLSFSDELGLVKLQQLQTSYPNAAIYLSGSVAVDMPEEIQFTSQPNQFQTASLVGSTLNLT
jgi:inner membrane protein